MSEDSGRILWSKESKLYLLGLIKDHSVIINPNVSSETMMKKEIAWMSIEQSFAADGMPCQLSKLKRLWKRMKDNSRQNTMKLSEQKRRGIKNIKPATDLDWKVHELLAGRKLDGRSKSKKGILQTKPATYGNSKSPPKQFGTRSTKLDVLKRDEYISDEDGNDLDSDSDLVDLLTPHQLQSSTPNGYHDAFEPVTIIEEVKRGQPIKAENELTIIDDDQLDDEYAFNRHVSSSANLNSDNGDESDINQLQRELLLHDIQLKLVQRQYEDERMGNERELFRKQSILLDLQTKKATIELQQIKSNPAQPAQK